MTMIPSESISQGSIGVGTAVVIAWLRSKGWFNNQWTLPLSYAAALLSTVGVHFMFQGDFITGSTLTIKIPDLEHVFDSLVLFLSNVTGQKGYALLNKLTDVSSRLTTLAQGPTQTTVLPTGPMSAMVESKPTTAAENKPGV